ncbi:MAG: hypothetical protein K0B37_18030 [Bacteroidales bacterium]|nr:hypothetical protein [Bacteroidales bacterium]
MVRKNPLLNSTRTVKARYYVCNMKMNEAIEEIYPDWRQYNYPHGRPGIQFKDGSFVSFNGRVGTVIYAYCDFTDKPNVPLSKTNSDDLMRLGKLQLKE